MDEGSQLNVIHASLIEQLGLMSVGEISIRGIVGQPVKSRLINLQVKLGAQTARDELQTTNNREYITILCAACNDLNEQLIVTLPVADELNSVAASNVIDSDILEAVDKPDLASRNGHKVDDAVIAVTTRSQARKTDVSVRSNNDENTETENSSQILNREQSFIDVDDVSPLQKQICFGSSSDLLLEKHNDVTLAAAFKLARQGKGNYLFKNSLLHRTENICGQQLTNLVVPNSRRLSVLKLAHDDSGCYRIRRQVPNLSNARDNYLF